MRAAKSDLSSASWVYDGHEIAGSRTVSISLPDNQFLLSSRRKKTTFD